MKLNHYFDRVVLINLARRPDRLLRIQQALEKCDWPFRAPEVLRAIDGETVPCPQGWQSGGGAWGCMRSHQLALEQAIMDRVESILVLEDDACFAEDFRNGIERFLEIVPSDWDQLMFGGQHINLNGPPILIKPGLYKCTDCERTHCYAVRGNYLKRLYQRWVSGGQFNGEVHCDWIMGRDPELQYSHNVYAPERFLIGQERGRSDINGALQPQNFWNPPASDLPVIVLHTSEEIVAELRNYGFHTGYRRDRQSDLDYGLIEIFKETAGNQRWRIERLGAWLNTIQWEVASDPRLICTVWHPEATLDLVKQSSRWPVTEIVTQSVEHILQSLPPGLKRNRRAPLAKLCVIHFKGPRRVMEELRRHGWHNGYWRDEESDVDKGLIAIFGDRLGTAKRRFELARIISLLQTEAEQIPHGVAVVWHPQLTPELIKDSTDTKVIQIESDRAKDTLEQWENIKASLCE